MRKTIHRATVVGAVQYRVPRESSGCSLALKELAQLMR